MNHSSPTADGGIFLHYKELIKRLTIKSANRGYIVYAGCIDGELLRLYLNENLLFLPAYSPYHQSHLPLFHPYCFHHPYLHFIFNFPSSHLIPPQLFVHFFSLPDPTSFLPAILHSPLSSASDIASDQGQVLVIVTAAVGCFTLLVILTLFLLITGR